MYRRFQLEFGDLERLEMVGMGGSFRSLHFITDSLLNVITQRCISAEFHFPGIRETVLHNAKYLKLPVHNLSTYLSISLSTIIHTCARTHTHTTSLEDTSGTSSYHRHYGQKPPAIKKPLDSHWPKYYFQTPGASTAFPVWSGRSHLSDITNHVPQVMSWWFITSSVYPVAATGGPGADKGVHELSFKGAMKKGAVLDTCRPNGVRFLHVLEKTAGVQMGVRVPQPKEGRCPQVWWSRKALIGALDACQRMGYWPCGHVIMTM